MAEVQPFRGGHYNQELLKKWQGVICPPYDIIPPQMQQDLYLRSEYNFIRIEYGRELPQDESSNNRYTRAAATLWQWLKQDILEIDTAPAIYLHDQYFTHGGKQYKRRGMIVRLRLEEWDKKIVRPHEGTTSQPKSDRLSLLWTLQTNTSPILAMFEDSGQKIRTILAAQQKKRPLLNLENMQGESHKVWAITDPGVVKLISDSLAAQPVYIADGHHRYESALNYRRDRLATASGSSGEESFNFVMMTLVDFADPGLIILPPHRLIRGISRSVLDELLPKLKSFFTIEELPVNEPGVWEKVDRLLGRQSGIGLTLFGLVPGQLLILGLRDPAAVSQMMPYFHSELYKKLDVSILDHVILENLLGLSGEKEEGRLAYTYDRQDAIKRVTAQEYQLTCLLSPVKSTIIKAVADAGDKMPRKSTYFYPKLPSGLIFNKLD